MKFILGSSFNLESINAPLAIINIGTENLVIELKKYPNHHSLESDSELCSKGAETCNKITVKHPTALIKLIEKILPFNF